MKKNFDYCLNLVLKDEGGYGNDPNDSGGPTNFGITIADYRKYIKRNGTPEDVKHMTVAQAKEIYRERYWNALDCDTLPSGVDYTCFDYAVNSGLGRPRKALQRFSNLSGTSLIEAINNERTTFLKALAARSEKDQKFLRGWLLRVTRVKNASLALAKKDNITGPSVATGGAAAGVGLWQYFHSHPYIIIGVVAATVIAGLAIHFYKNR